MEADVSGSYLRNVFIEDILLGKSLSGTLFFVECGFLTVTIDFDRCLAELVDCFINGSTINMPDIPFSNIDRTVNNRFSYCDFKGTIVDEFLYNNEFEDSKFSSCTISDDIEIDRLKIVDCSYYPGQEPEAPKRFLDLLEESDEW